MIKNRLEHRIFTFSEYAKRRYGEKTYKIGISTGIICPHRKNNGGCIFCNPQTFIGDYQKESTSISEQLDIGIQKIIDCCGNGNMLAYFQDETSTAGDISVLKQKFEEALNHPKINGLILSTRPDYIDEKVLAMLKSLDTNITVELGMQSIHEKSLEFLNRGHTQAQTEKAINLLGRNKINVGVHLILGIPTEIEYEMIETVKYVSGNPYIKEVKFHNLVPYKNTKFGKMIELGEIKPYLIKEHIQNLAAVIPFVKGDIAISRLFTSNVRNTNLNIIKYTGNKTKWMNELRILLNEKDIVQGAKTDILYEAE